MNIWPIAIPNIDWPLFIRVGKELTGVSPVARLNAERQDVDGPAALLKAVGSFNPKEPVELGHASLSFLIECEYQTSIAVSMRSDLCLTVSDKLPGLNVVMIASGTVGQWREAFLSLCHYGKSPEVIAVFNRLYKFFEQANLTQFLNFRRIELPSGYFVVEAA